MRPHGQDRIEHQHPLLRPGDQIAVVGDLTAISAFQLFVLLTSEAAAQSRAAPRNRRPCAWLLSW